MGVPGAINDVQPFAELCQGATTVVYKAHQRSLDRFVLLKRLRGEHRHDAALARRFEDEARLAARVRHPNVVAVHAFGQDDEGAYLVTEFVEGMDVAGLLARGQVPVEVAVFILEEAARGLQAAHEQGVLHRDLKPSNILLSHAGEVKLADFGMASVVGDEAPAEGEAQVRGTLAYLPPEQVLGQPPTPASDLFSLGATGFELLTGRRAFTGAVAADLFDAVLNHDPLPVLEANPHVPPALTAVIRRLLARDPAARFAGAAALLAALRAFREEAGLPTGPEVLRAFLDDPDAFRAASAARRSEAAARPAHGGDGLPEPAAAMPAPEPAAPKSAVPKPPARRTLLGLAAVLLLAAAGYAGVVLLDGGPARPTPPAASPPEADAPPAIPQASPPAQEEATAAEAAETAGPESDPDPAGPEPSREEPAEPAAPAGSAGTTLPEAPPLAPPATGTLRVDAWPYAEVVVGGAVAGTTPLQVALSAGAHEVVLRHPEFPPHHARVDVPAGGAATLSVALAGRLAVVVYPYADVWVDGTYRDTTPLEAPLVLAPGPHALSLRHPSLGRKDTTVTIEAGTERVLRYRFGP